MRKAKASEPHLSEFTFGVGSRVPVSRVLGLGREVTLSGDYAWLDHPIYSEGGGSAGKFYIFSLSLGVDL